ncbi:MAG: methyltransferase domain-containing protein [Candidatus Bathyarchaeota archaeon]|nr:MAG: methyltransferase domain-containing protein [Candidatus Bathyarchaeota archaeon]
MYEPGKIRDYYDGYGDREWDRLEASLHGKVHYEVTKHILERHLPEEGHILDAGCGPGRYAIHLAKEGYRVQLVDISEEQLKLAAEKIDEAGVRESVTGMRRMDVCDLSEIPDASFDAVLCLGGALSYVRDRRHEALSELIRVAKPGSPLIVSVMSLFGTFHLIPHFDAMEFLKNLVDHVEWDPATPFPDVLNSRVGSNEWHAPMTVYSSDYMRRFVGEHGCEVLEIASTNTITSSYWKGPEKISADPEASETLIRLEKEFSTKPGLVDMGEHLIIAARTPRDVR